MLEGVLGVIHLVLFIIALIQIIGANKPVGWKVVWALIVLLLPIIGLILFFLLGK